LGSIKLKFQLLKEKLIQNVTWIGKKRWRWFMGKYVIYQWSLNTKPFGPLNNVTWIIMLLGLQRSCNCKR
jgi:hypothetical protein